MNYFFSIKNEQLDCSLIIPKFKNNREIDRKYILFSSQIKNNKWFIEEAKCANNENFYFLKNQDLDNHKIFFLAKKEEVGENKFYSEVLVSSDKLKLAGTIDLIEALGKKHINIWDIKTNYEMDKKKNGKLLIPFQDIDNTKINKYRLQLSMYKYLCELKGIIVDKLYLLHWTGNEWIKSELEPIDISIIWSKK